MGYKSRAEFIKEAIREKLKTILREILEQLPLEHFNLSENGVRILDRSLANTQEAE
jgi:Arc/MetJ-type ribon-helix-helix transcriptional regulator